MTWKLYALDEIRSFPTGENGGYIICYPPGGGRYKTCSWEFVHRLMAESAIGKRLDKTVDVHHKDEDKHHNEISNFEILSESEHGKLHSPLLGEFVPCEICVNIFYLSLSNKKRNRKTCSRKCSAKLPLRIEGYKNLRPPDRKDFCKNGHPLSGSNLRILVRRGREERICRQCVRVRNSASKRRKRVSND